MDPTLIEFEDVHKTLGDTQVLKGVDLRIYRGQITTIIGKSGGGKSVLLKHMIGLIRHDQGRILYDGRPLAQMKTAQRRELNRKFSYMFQGTALFDSLNVYDNVALPLTETRAMGKPEIRRRVSEKLALLDLRDIEKKFPAQLSGGMKKRVALARALVTEPEIVLFDEPTTGLDPIRKNAVHSMIADYQRRFGFTGVIVSHDIPDIFFISQQVAMLDEGRILFQGSPEDIQQSNDPVVDQFIHGLAVRRDDLTGMATQGQGDRRLLQELSRFQRHRTSLSLLLLTIENMDEIFTRIGHENGQRAFGQFASKIRSHLRANDSCSRHNINEILVILPDTDLGQARQVCAKLVRKLNQQDIRSMPPGNEFCFDISAGLVQAAANRSLEQLLSDAQAARSPVLSFKVC